MDPLQILALQGLGTAYAALPVSFLVYVLLLIDARRKNSPAADDTQLGLKTVAASVIIVATVMFAFGMQSFLHTVLTFEDFGARFKAAVPNLLCGGLGVVGTAFLLFPRTNAARYPKAKRLASGIVALLSGGVLLPSIAVALERILAWPSWSEVAKYLSIAVVVLAVFTVSFAVLLRLSGVDVAPARPPGPTPGVGAPVAAAPGYPQQHPGAYPPAGYAVPGQGAPGQPVPGAAPPDWGGQQ